MTSNWKFARGSVKYILRFQELELLMHESVETRSLGDTLWALRRRTEQRVRTC